MPNILSRLCAAILALPALGLAQGTVLWNESVNGPLSNIQENPTLLAVLQPGTNSLWGASELVRGTPSGVFPDYFQFTVPFGFRVTSLGLTGDRPSSLFIADANFSFEYGVKTWPANGDLLPQLGLTELSANAYGMSVQNFDYNNPDVSILNYRLDFVLTPVPEPGTWALLGLGGLAFWSLARRRPHP